MKLRSVMSVLALSLMMTACGFEIVDTGNAGIQTRYGEVIGAPKPSGLYFYNPFTSSIREFSIRQETWTDKTAIFTRDTQRVDVEFAVTFYPDAKFVGDIYKEVGSERMLAEKIIKPVVLGSIKDAIGMVIADELVGKREAATRAALKEVKDNLAERHVIVTDLQFTNLDFDDAYEKAVEQKVVAIQEAQRAVNQTLTVKEQAKQTIMTAEAQAKSMQIQSAALAQNKGLISYEWVKKWNGALPSVQFGSGATPMVNLDSLMRESNTYSGIQKR